LGWVYEHSPFYREKFDREGFRPGDFKSMENIRRIPLTHKDEVRQAVSRAGNALPHLCLPIAQIAGFGCSRGTTGTSTFAAFSKEDIDRRVECYTRSLFQLGLSRGHLFHAMMGIQSITHFILREASTRLHANYVNDGVDNAGNSVQIGKWLRPTILLTGVRTLFEMEKVLEADKALPKEVFSYEKAVLYGDVVGSHLIDHVRRKWGIDQVFSLSGSAADLLWYNFDCPAHLGNHCLNEDMFLVEVIHPGSGSPVAEGQKGQLVVTDLCSNGAPHIRWNLEDVVIPFYEPCPCGRTHMRLKYLGRALYEVTVRGKAIFPVEVEHLLWKLPEVEGAEFRIVKFTENMDRLKLQIEFAGGEERELKRRIRRQLEESLEMEVEVEFLGPGRLPVMDVKTPRVLDLTRA